MEYKKIDGSDYTLPVASKTQLGGVKVGENLNITEDGVLSVVDSGGSANVDVIYENEKLPNPSEFNGLGIVDLSNGLPYYLRLKTMNNYGYTNIYEKTKDLRWATNRAFGENNLFAYKNSNAQSFIIYDVENDTQLLEQELGTYETVLTFIDTNKIGYYQGGSVGSVHVFDTETQEEVVITLSGLNSGGYITFPYAEKISDGVYHKLYFNTDTNSSGLFEINLNTKTLTRLSRITPKIIGASDYLFIVNYDIDKYLIITKRVDNNLLLVYLYENNDATLLYGALQGTQIMRCFKEGNYIYLCSNSMNITINLVNKTFTNIVSTSEERLDTSYGIFLYKNNHLLKFKPSNQEPDLFYMSYNHYVYYNIEIGGYITTYTLQDLNAVMLTSQEQLTYQIPINK